MVRFRMASLRSPALLRATSSLALLAFGFAAGPRETMHSACPMHDGAALAQAVTSTATSLATTSLDATSAAHHHGAETTDSHAHGGGQDQQQQKPQSCDCRGDCAPGSTRALALPTEVATAPAAVPPALWVVPPFHETELRFVSSDYLLPPATAPPSSV
jgi:hypothetical protein